MSAREKQSNINLYESVQRICNERNITISEVERKAGLGNGVIRKWDHASPTLRTLFAVTDYLGVTLNDLLDQPEEKT